MQIVLERLFRNTLYDSEWPEGLTALNMKNSVLWNHNVVQSDKFPLEHSASTLGVEESAKLAGRNLSSFWLLTVSDDALKK
jgi:hypothetical protein